MPIYLVDIEVKPTHAIPEGSYVAQASAITFVDAEHEEAALLKARSYLIEHGWQEIKLNNMRLVDAVAIPHLEKEIAQAYWTAVRFGVGAIMAASPISPDTAASYPQIRTLTKPPNTSH
jgi:hypothetical protein